MRFQDFTVSETASSGEPIDLTDAKRQLRLLSGDFDAELGTSDGAGKIAAARAWAERITERTLRTSVTRVAEGPEWPDGVRNYFARPPLSSVTSIQYYDTDETLQTVAASNYHVFTPTDGKAYFSWDEDFTFPQLHDRPDAVQVTYVSGGTVTPEVKEGILLLLQALWGEDDAFRPGSSDRLLERAKEILSGAFAVSYA